MIRAIVGPPEVVGPVVWITGHPVCGESPELRNVGVVKNAAMLPGPGQARCVRWRPVRPHSRRVPAGQRAVRAPRWPDRCGAHHSTASGSPAGWTGAPATGSPSSCWSGAPPPRPSSARRSGSVRPAIRRHLDAMLADGDWSCPRAPGPRPARPGPAGQGLRAHRRGPGALRPAHVRRHGHRGPALDRRPRRPGGGRRVRRRAGRRRWRSAAARRWRTPVTTRSPGPRRSPGR